ncbi:MAG: DUF3078 domain-containing protein [Bacteroidota bacterium]
MRKQLLLLVLLFASANFVLAQTAEEMAAEKAQKEKELAELKPQAEDLAKKVAALEGDIASLTDQLTPYPRWDVGSNGTIGLNIANFNDWLSKEKSNTTAINIGLAMNAFANMQQEKYFWRNSAGLNLGWIKFNDDDADPNEPDGEFEVAADAFNLVSLLGYKLNEKLAISALAEYRTAVLGGRFNNPGFLDIGAGITWTPITDLVVVIHPLNYNFVFAEDTGFEYTSSLGAKIVADYKTELFPGVAWKSNLSAFLSYKDPAEFSNWTWINGLSTAIKGVGIGFELGVRRNKQEALGRGFDANDNPTQIYWTLGFAYGISSN